MTHIYPESTLLGAVLGSQAQGFATADSDTDRGAVFIAPREQFLLSGFREPIQSYQKHEPDIWGHELGKFCRLAAACNPTILELLFVPEHEFMSDSGRLLVKDRHLFLSSHRLVAAYQGFATSQVKRAAADETMKPRRHALRLLWQCAETLRTGALPVWVPRDARDEILYWTTQDEERFLLQCQYYQLQILEALKDTPIPDYTDDAKIETLISKIRRDEYGIRRRVHP